MAKRNSNKAVATIGATAVAALSAGQALSEPSKSGTVIDLIGLLNNKDQYFCRDKLASAIEAEGKAAKSYMEWAREVYEQGIRTIMLPDNTKSAHPIIDAMKDVIASAKLGKEELHLYRIGRAEIAKLTPEAKKLRETVQKRVTTTYGYCRGLLAQVEREADIQFRIAQGGEGAALIEQGGDTGGAGKGTTKGTRNLGERVKEAFGKWTNALNKLESRTEVETEFLNMMVSWEKKLQFLTSK